MRKLNTPVAQDSPTLPIPPQPQVERTVTEKTVGPANLVSPPTPTSASGKVLKPDLNTWYRNASIDERVKHAAYYLYRLDPNIKVIYTNLEGRADGAMLYKLTDEQINKFGQGTFLEELILWIKEEYGGGWFRLMINNTKTAGAIYNVSFPIEGRPKLSSREDYVAPGTSPGAGSSGMSGDPSTVRMLIEFIDKKLDAVKSSGQNPAEAVGQVTQVLMDSQSKMFAWMLEHQPKATDSVSQLEQMRNMLMIVREIMPQPSTQIVPQKSTLEQMQELTAMIDAVEKLRATRNPQDQPTLAAAISEGIAKAGISRAKGNDYSWLIEIAKAAVPVLTPIGIALAEKIKKAPAPGEPPAGGIRIVARGGPVGTAQPAQPAGGAATVRPGGNGMPGNGMPGGQPVPAQAAPPPPPPAAPPSDRIIDAETVDAVIQHTISTRLVDMLQHNVDGSVAAEAIDNMFPQTAAMMAFATVDMIKARLAEDPICSIVKDDVRLPAFLDNFHAYFHPVEPGEPEHVQ